MAKCSKSKVTVVQLFFLSFSYVFSGLFLIRERSFLSLLLPLSAVLVFSLFGYFFLQCAPRVFAEKERFLRFLSCGRPHFISRALMALLIFLSALEMLLTWMMFAYSVYSFSAFLSFSLAAALVLFLALLTGSHGLAVLGRFSELSVFWIAPLFFRTIFRGFSEVDFSAFSSDLCALLTITPAPLLYLFSMTVSESTAMPKPIKNLAVIPLCSFLGAVLAALCAFLFLLFGAGERSVFYILFGWTASVIRLSLLICVCTADCFPRHWGQKSEHNG